MAPFALPDSSDASSVIVGVDGSPGAIHALAWTVAKSDALGPVSLVHVFQQPTRSELDAWFGTRVARSTIRRAAECHLTKAVGATNPDLIHRAHLLEGHPGVMLCEVAVGARLLVVGTRGRSSAVADPLGSISSHCAQHASVPVAIIPANAPVDRPLSKVVVGVDGSEHGDRALRWAIDHVAEGGRIHAVGARPTVDPVDDEQPGLGRPTPDVEEKQIRDRVEAAVARVTGYPYDGPSIKIHAVAENPRIVLRNLAGVDADLLVIGARGLGPVPHLVLGAVSSALIHHPQVPTVVVHGDGTR